MKCFASAQSGTIPLLCSELTTLGATRIEARHLGAQFEADQEAIYRICLWSRIANRVLMPVNRFKVHTPEDLYREVKAIHWEKHLHSSGSLAVDVAGGDSELKHSHYALLTVKDAIVDSFRERFGERPEIDTETPDLRIQLLLNRDRVQISIDLSGGSLHRRGYRQSGGAAPLKENLAAAILLHGGWDRIAGEGGELYDPMFGSGTLLIEAALIAGDIAPGLTRKHFGFLGWRRHRADIWEKLLTEAEERRRSGLLAMPRIIGSDISPKAFDVAMANIRALQLEDHIELRLDPLADHPYHPESEHGLLVVNPPYGDRLGEVKSLRQLYHDLGEVGRKLFSGWHVALFSGNNELIRSTGFIDPKPIEMSNGQIPCQLYRTHLGQTIELSEGAKMLTNRLKKNLKHLRRWAGKQGVTSYRIYDADLPEYAVAIDLYHTEEEHQPHQWVVMQEYSPPKTISADVASQRLQEAEAVVLNLLNLPAERLYLKVRERQRGKSQYQRQKREPLLHQVVEGKVHLWVNFDTYLDTGLFLDHRNIRLWIGENSKEKSFLNLFAYTCSATMHAALGGASSTTSVDLSRRYIDWGKKNLQLNHLPQHRHQLIHANVVNWLKQQRQLPNPNHYDLIFLDPPTFSNSRDEEEDFVIQRDHLQIIDDASALLRPEGTLIFSTNFRKFKLDSDISDNYRVEEITRDTIGEDFRRKGNIHRCWLIRQQ